MRYVDFDEEIHEISRLLSSPIKLSEVPSPLDALSGLETAKVGQNCLVSARESRVIKLN